MSYRLKLEGLQAERSAVDTLLSQANQWGDEIGKIQLARKKELLEEEIANLLGSPDKNASISLYFGGDPVLGSRGISAEFAGTALETFQELVSRSYAKAELGAIGERGPVPLKQATKLMVTSIAKGSFGFVLDELSDQSELSDTPLKGIVEEVASLIEKAASPNEIDFENVMETLDARTLVSLKDLFVNLDKSSATFRILEEKFDYTLDHSSIARARRRTESTEIQEEEGLINATLEGFLPDHKKFEVRINDELVYGSTTKQASEQFLDFVSSGMSVITQNWVLKAIQKTITPLNRPPRNTYKLLEFVRKLH